MQDPPGSPRFTASGSSVRRGREMPAAWAYTPVPAPAPAPARLEPGGSLPGILAQHPSPGLPCRQSRGANRLHRDTELLRFVAHVPGGMRVPVRVVVVSRRGGRTPRQRDLLTRRPAIHPPQRHGAACRPPGRGLRYRCHSQHRTPPATERGRIEGAALGRTSPPPRRPEPGIAVLPVPHRPCGNGSPFCQAPPQTAPNPTPYSESVWPSPEIIFIAATDPPEGKYPQVINKGLTTSCFSHLSPSITDGLRLFGLRRTSEQNTKLKSQELAPMGNRCRSHQRKWLGASPGRFPLPQCCCLGYLTLR